MMNPKALVVTLSVVNLLIGTGLGIALDRTVLHCDQGTEVAEQAPTPTPNDSEIGDAPKDGQAHDAPRDERTRDAPKDGHRRGKRRGRSDWLKRALDLDDEQAKQVKAIMQARRPKFEAVFSAVRPKLKALEEETHAEILKVLRPEQVEKFEEMRKRFKSMRGFRGRRRGMRGSRGWGGRGDGRHPDSGERGEGEQPTPSEDGGK